MYKFQNTGQLTAQIDELKKEVSALKRERKVLFFIALSGVSYAVLQFAPVAAVVLFVVSFSLCFLEDIVKGK
jgi:Ni/Fe-hydrogenase subunit HybB-like protein